MTTARKKRKKERKERKRKKEKGGKKSLDSRLDRCSLSFSTRASPLYPVRAQVVRTHNADAQDGGVGRAGGKGGGIIRDLKGRLEGEGK